MNCFSIRTSVATLAALASLVPVHAQAAWVTTGWLTDLEIRMDNGKTYFSGFTTTGNCTYDRLELSETGGYYGNPENAKRMYSLILTARASGKAIRLGYWDQDGPACRVAQVYVQW